MEKQLDFLPYFLIFFKRWKIILLNFLFILLASSLYAFVLTKKEYKAEIVFLPPGGSESSLSDLIGGNISLPSLTSSEIMPEQISVIFSSKAFKRRVIEKFNLYDHYKMKKNQNKLLNTIKKLDKSLVLSAEEIGSIGITKTVSFSLTALHTSPDTAYQMANFSFCLLDSAVQAVSIDRAHRDRVFVESQLEKNKTILDSLQVLLKDFQVKNKAYDVPEQVKMTIQAYADLKAEMTLNEIRMHAIAKDFSKETPEYFALKMSNQAIEGKLQQLDSQGSPDAMLSLQNTAKLLPDFVNLKRDVEIQNQIILFLSRELEQAKIKEEKNVSSLVVADPAFVPEYKTRPKRITIIAVATSLYMLFFLLFILVMEVFRIQIRNSQVMQAIISSLKKRE
jgi:uncharacterized protein involved in exopolysaccharide biosynthesis